MAEGGRLVRKLLKAEVLAARENLLRPGPDQGALLASIREMRDAGRVPPPGPGATAWETWSVYSQWEEDAILLHLFGILGMTNRRCVELCAGDAMECNTTSLILRHGFTGLLCDGGEANVRGARRFFARCRATRAAPPTVVCRWLTAENVNAVVGGAGLHGPVDLLSIDVDGIDYWLWKALEVVRPRVVVIEMNHLWGAERSVTVPYDPDFTPVFTRHGSDYAGASLPALVGLARSRGYRLVTTNAIATNAFFALDDLCDPWLPKVDAAECFDHPRARFGREHRLPGVREMPWEEV